MPELHVAALPFPSRQGTQAAVDAMLRARAENGTDAHLLTYGDSERDADEARPYAHHRAPSLPGRASLRSGPSARKLVLDALLVRSVASAARTLRPRVVVAHHVEAMAAVLAAGAGPAIFFAHTDLGAELPTYLPPSLTPLLGHAGRSVDRALCKRARAVAAISPMLRDALEDATDLPVAYVPPPWPVPAPVGVDARRAARRALALSDDAQLLLYAGNLDRYQGWPLMVAALAALPEARLLVATASDPAPLRREARRAGVGQRLDVVPLPADEPGRARLHAAADVALIPRLARGGLPIKLLDALARGVPTVAARRAAAGLPLGGSVALAVDDDAASLASCARVLLSAPRSTEELGARGRDYVRQHHAPARFVDALDALRDRVVSQIDSRKATRSLSSASLRRSTSPWRLPRHASKTS